MDKHHPTWQRTPVDDILDYAMGIGLLLTATAAIGLLSIGVQPILAISSTAIIGGLWVFTITPHLVAYWVGIDVEKLLGIHQGKTSVVLSDDTTRASDVEDPKTNY